MSHSVRQSFILICLLLYSNTSCHEFNRSFFSIDQDQRRTTTPVFFDIQNHFEQDGSSKGSSRLFQNRCFNYLFFYVLIEYIEFIYEYPNEQNHTFIIILLLVQSLPMSIVLRIVYHPMKYLFLLDFVRVAIVLIKQT